MTDMDIKSPLERSRNMAKIKGKNTSPERFVRSLLHQHGLRYRIHRSDLPGKPDLYFPAGKVAVFVHGCYWHRHPGCKYAYTPKSNTQFWLNKLEGNRRRDETVVRELHDQGIRVLVIWECTVKQMQRQPELSDRILEQITIFLQAEIPYLEL